MPKTTVLHEGVVRPSFVAELDAFRAPAPQATSFYLDVDPKKWGGEKAARIAVKDAAAQQRERVEGMSLGHAVRHALRRDLALAEELADHAIGERHTLAVACILA